MKKRDLLAAAIFRIPVVFAAAVVLQGCAVSQITSGLGTNWFGSSSSDQSDQSVAGVSEERLLAAAKTDATGAADVPTTAQGCPKFVVWPRDRNLTVYEPGKEGDGLAIRYRSEITKTARECQLIPGTVTVKYGFAGRVLLGPKGQAGPATVPAVVYVTDKDRNKIKTESVNVPISMVQGQPLGYFSYVRRISFTVPAGTSASDYKLYVAFDRRGARL